jgi:Fe-S-cluster formation regulator IscX/YfhJ
MNNIPPYVRLERVLDGFSDDLVAASDDEILAAAASLEIKPLMKGSAAYFGMKSLYAPYREGLFEDPEMSEERVIDAIAAWRARKEDAPK